ncbi:hypothetical protein H5410_030112 [Solanum commersonii]|uniref:TIR domain-containing protein n=1 Tax=Solanum commersonii TaxID=4109 RepID=A0A9J5YIC2_SOLCO|nr:hypothetical protein H5410_030112 [Solanum commersonii]
MNRITRSTSMASSSSCASDPKYYPRWKYDVFLSFRGVDTRRTFTGHLYEGLKNRGIFTFQDDKEESQVAIVLSKNYATSLKKKERASLGWPSYADECLFSLL